MTSHHPAHWPPPGHPDLRMFVPRERRVVPLLLWTSTLAAALALLLWLGDGRLAAPDLTAPATWGDWARDRGTAEAVVALLRVTALGLAWYLVGVTTVSVLAHAARVVRLVRVADALSFGPVRTVVQQALGVGLAVGVVASALPSGAAPAPTSAADVTTAAIGHDDREHAPWTSSGGGAAGSVVGAAPPVPAPDDGPARLVARPLAPADEEPSGRRAAAADDGVAAADRPDPRPTDSFDGPGAVEADDVLVVDTPTGPSTGGAADATVGAGTSPGEVRVEPGDHLWGLAEQQLVDELGRPPSEGEIVRHWERVVERNAGRLVVPTNPDLLRPGQRIVLPAVEVGG